MAQVTACTSLLHRCSHRPTGESLISSHSILDCAGRCSRHSLVKTTLEPLSRSRVPLVSPPRHLGCLRLVTRASLTASLRPSGPHFLLAQVLPMMFSVPDGLLCAEHMAFSMHRDPSA